jgi:RNA polymerase sigma-70 factor (ECF subfamily)
MPRREFISFDPGAPLLRNRPMLTTTSSLEETDACGDQTAYAAVLPGVVRETMSGNRRVADVHEGEWAGHVRRIRTDRDQSAFAELFRHFAPRVKAFLKKSGASDTLAEECTQEVMATLWHKAHLFDPTRASVATWIFTIARNRKIDMIRKTRRPEPEDLPWGPETDPGQEEALALQQETDKLGDALRRLPEKQRELVEKAYFGELSHTEIAAQTGLPLGTIKSRIRLALERLRYEMR